jgi:hypothetical protein
MRLALPIALCAATFAVPAAAALAPNYQRIVELQAVLALREVAALGAPVDRVEWVGVDRYRVSGGGCRIEVAIIDLPTPRDRVGGRRFEARPGRKSCGK